MAVSSNQMAMTPVNGGSRMRLDDPKTEPVGVEGPVANGSSSTSISPSSVQMSMFPPIPGIKCSS